MKSVIFKLRVEECKNNLSVKYEECKTNLKVL